MMLMSKCEKYAVLTDNEFYRLYRNKDDTVSGMVSCIKQQLDLVDKSGSLSLPVKLYDIHYVYTAKEYDGFILYTMVQV